MEIWVRVLDFGSDVTDLTKGREYRVVGFHFADPIVIDDVQEFHILDRDYVNYVIIDVNFQTKRDPK